jgi:hypothetical protein
MHRLVVGLPLAVWVLCIGGSDDGATDSPAPDTGADDTSGELPLLYRNTALTTPIRPGPDTAPLAAPLLANTGIGRVSEEPEPYEGRAPWDACV